MGRFFSDPDGWEARTRPTTARGSRGDRRRLAAADETASEPGTRSPLPPAARPPSKKTRHTEIFCFWPWTSARIQTCVSVSVTHTKVTVHQNGSHACMWLCSHRRLAHIKCGSMIVFVCGCVTVSVVVWCSVSQRRFQGGADQFAVRRKQKRPLLRVDGHDSEEEWRENMREVRSESSGTAHLLSVGR